MHQKPLIFLTTFCGNNAYNKESWGGDDSFTNLQECCRYCRIRNFRYSTDWLCSPLSYYTNPCPWSFLLVTITLSQRYSAKCNYKTYKLKLWYWWLGIVRMKSDFRGNLTRADSTPYSPIRMNNFNSQWTVFTEYHFF